MRFLSLEIQNFMSYGPKQTVLLARRGLVGVIGNNKDARQADSNGAGKSAIVEAIAWCLWGKTIREIENVTNKKVKKNCEVSLYIEDDNKVYKVTRTQGGTKKKANDILVTIDGTPATAGTNKDTQALIDIIVGMDFQTFTQAVLLTYRGKSVCAMKDSEQKKILENILQIDVIAKAREIVKGRLSSAQNQLALSRVELQALQTKCQDLQVHLEKAIRFSKEQGAVKQAKVSELVDKREKLKLRIKNLCLTSQFEIVEKELGAIEHDMQNLMKESYERTKLESEAIRAISTQKTELQKHITVTETQMAMMSDNSAKLSNMADIECPTCMQDVTADYVELSLASIEKKLNAAHQVLHMLKAKYNDLQISDRNLAVIIDKSQQEISQKKTKLLTRQQDLLGKLREFEGNKQLANELAQLVCGIEDEIKSLDKATDPYENVIKELTEALEKSKEDAELVEKRAQTLDYTVQHLLFWDHGFSNKGLKSFIIENAIPFLNERAQYYADILSGGDLSIEFSAQTQLKSGDMREQLQIKVSNQQGSEVYDGNSDGEKRRSDIAVGWALGDLAASRSKKSINFKCLDEPFENLDESGEDAMLRLLHSELPRYETIFVVTHNSDFQDKLPGCLKVVKHKGFSQIEGE